MRYRINLIENSTNPYRQPLSNDDIIELEPIDDEPKSDELTELDKKHNVVFKKTFIQELGGCMVSLDKVLEVFDIETLGKGIHINCHADGELVSNAIVSLLSNLRKAIAQLGTYESEMGEPDFS